MARNDSELRGMTIETALAKRGWVKSPIEEQEVYILHMHMLPIRCPLCAERVTKLEGACGRKLELTDAIPDEYFERAVRQDADHQCWNCGVKLRYGLSIFGEQFWTITDEDRQKVVAAWKAAVMEVVTGQAGKDGSQNE